MHGSIHLFDRLPQVDATPVAANDVALSPLRARPLVGLIRNRRSHRNGGADGRKEPPAGVIMATPHKRSELPQILADFAAKRVDYIAIDGGDGTVRDVLTCGAGVFGDCWPMIIVLPNGKTNALAIDLGLPAEWSLEQALEAVERGKVVRRQPLVIAQRDNARAQVRGFALGGGVFNQVVALGQKSHKLGAFNSAVIGLTAVWSVAQTIFGFTDNQWRRGTRMELRTSDGATLPHRGGGPADERFLLFVSTLQTFPAGLDPFREVSHPMQVAVLDNSRRSLLFRLPAIFRGTASQATRDRGYHVFGDSVVELDIADAFILDGEAFPAGNYRLTAGPKLRFVVP